MGSLSTSHREDVVVLTTRRCPDDWQTFQKSRGQPARQHIHSLNLPPGFWAASQSGRPVAQRGGGGFLEIEKDVFSRLGGCTADRLGQENNLVLLANLHH